MNIYYINIEKFKKNHNKNFLSKYSDREFKNEKRFYEYSIGRYLIKNVAQKIYKIEDSEIIINKNGKPIFKNSNLHFSLSHSNDYVIACFDINQCGIDIEFLKKRDFKKIAGYYGENIQTSEEFYKYWTLKEASYKLGKEVKDSYSMIFKNNYCLTIVSEQIFDKNIEIIYFE